MRPARPCFPAQGPPRRLPSTGSHAESPTGGLSASAPAHRPQRWVPHGGYPARVPTRRVPYAQGPQRSAPPSFPYFAAPGQQLLPDRSLPQCPRPFSTFAAAPRQQKLPDGSPPRCSWPAKASRWSSATVPLASKSSAIAPGQQQTSQRPGQQHLPDGSAPRHPGQQQTSSGGEKDSGLASNLAHLSRIC